MKRYVRASANCGTFTVEIEAKIDTKKVLMREEIVEIQKELRQRLSDTIAKLPHGQIYPHEVVFAMKTQGLNLHTKEGMISLYREFSEVIAHLDKILYSFSGMSELSSAGIGSSKDFTFSHIPELYRIKEDMILKIGKAVVNESGGLL